MKRAIAVRLLTGLIAFTALAAFAGSAAWFIPTASIDPDNTPIEGETMGAYFAYGDGTPEHPYGITKPRHVYNLAWLQYLGMFNNVSKSTSPNYNRQFRFEVAADVDMGGIVIPPIGTTEFPFVGELQGQDHIISNFSVSNSFSDLKVHPAAINSGNFKNNVVKIVGFFGVVGNYDDQFSGAGIVYNSAINTINDLGLTDFKVTTVASDTLIGMAAGWVDADISNVGVDVATVDVAVANATAYDGGSITNRLSDFGIVGYTTKKKQITRYSDTVYGVSSEEVDQFTVEDQGSSAAWGGSINMKKIYTDLHTVWAAAPNAGYVQTRTDTHDVFGRLVSRTETVNGTAIAFPYAEYEGRYSTTGDTQHHFRNAQKKVDNKITASYGFVRTTTDNTGTYISITGDRDVLTNSNNTTSETTDLYTGHYINIRNTQNYLSITGNNIVNATSATDADLWNFDTTANTISGFDKQTSNIRYLNCSNTGVLSAGATKTSSWYYDPVRSYYYTTSGTTYYILGFENNTWKTTSSTRGDYFELYANATGRYLYAAGNSNYVGVQASSSNYTQWYLDGDTYVVPRQYTSTKLRRYNNNDPARLYTSNSTTRALMYDGTKFYTSGWFSDTTYYLYINDSGQPSASTDSQYAGQISVVWQMSTPADISQTSVAYQTEETRYKTETSFASTRRAIVHSYPTFWPLKNKGDETDATGDDDFGNPAESNTGYFVGGANYTGDPNGDIRFSAFPDQHRNAGSSNVASLNQSYTPGSDSFNHVYTINGSGKLDLMTLTQANRDARYPKFQKAANKLIPNLKSNYKGNGNGQIYGLHFMDAKISHGFVNGKDTSTYVERAVINKTTYERFELPTTCIDFNLKDRGRITFFAGTYFWGSNTTGGQQNNSFFSLHSIERYSAEEAAAPGAEAQGIRKDGIKNLREIKYIYEHKTDPSADYVYAYNTNPITYSATVNLSEYNQIFDTDWIKRQASAGSGSSSTYLYDAAYYFEIPVNSGEYALGSVQGTANNPAVGGYLMYLDIGANAALLNRVVFGEKHVLVESQCEYPLGVAFVKTSNLAAQLSAGIDPENSACISIYTGSKGDFTLTRTDGAQVQMTMTSTDAADLSIKATYTYDTIKMHDPGGNPVVESPRSKTTTTVERTRFVDYNAVLAETTTTAVVTTTVTTVTDSGTTTTTGPTKSYWQDSPESETRITDPDDIIFYSEEDGTAVSITSVSTKAALETTLINYVFRTEDGKTATVTFELASTPNSTTHYHEIVGYNIVVEDSEGNAVTVTGVGVAITIIDGVQTANVTIGEQDYVIKFNVPDEG